MNIINDKTIEHNTAKYWCIFADQKFVELLNSLTKNESVALGALVGYASLAFTGLSVIKLVSPLFKNMWRKCFSSKEGLLAEVQFNADGTKYKAYFDMDDMKWKLHGNMSISEHETIQFFETKFFNDFNAQCIKYIQPILASKDSLLRALNSSNSKKIDAKYKNFLVKLLNNDNQITANMFDPHYMT